MPIKNIPKAFIKSEQVDPVTYNARLDICQNCPLRLAASGWNFNQLSTCPECGCFVYLKAKIRVEECPKNKW
jgi:hypothetical protein